MFGKWLKRDSVPSNAGNLKSQDIEKLQYVKVFDLELSNMEDAPTYTLKHQLSIGSEIGNIVIADPSVSPRHASFILQQEVVSVIDHGSVSGTYVNGTKIPPGKYIILEETDVVNVGDLEVKLRIRTEAIPEDVIPEIPTEEEEASEEIPEEDESEEEVVEEKAPAKIFNPREHLKNSKPKKKLSAVQGPAYATNSLVRIVAVLGDILLAYSLLVILMPFDEFREFLDFIPNFFLELMGVDWKGMWEAVVADYGFLGEMSQDLYQFMSSTFHIGPLLLMFILTRLVSTFILGVSISEFVLGVRAHGNGIWARVGGVLRVLIGVVTGPFLIFDIPAVISRRTFKEFMTFTHTYLSSKFIAILGTILYIPILLALALVSPMLQGFEPPEPILVNDKIEQRMKVRTEEGTGAPQGEVAEVRDMSRYFNLELKYDPSKLSVLPSFKFQGVKNKLNLKPGLVFYQKDLLRTVGFEIYKNFDLKELLGIGMKGNVFLYEKYPEIYDFVYSSEGSNPSFKIRNDVKSQISFANQFISFTKMAFSLSADNALEVMETETLLTKGLVDYKASFLALIEYKDFDQIGFIKIGNIIFMKISFYKQKPFDLIIPLMKGDGRIFKVAYDKRENLNDVSSKFYKFNLEDSNWLPDHSSVGTNPVVMSTFQVIDLFAANLKEKPITLEKAQSLYAYYFETSAAVLSRKDPGELELWKATIKTTMKLLETLPAKAANEGQEDPKLKLEQNFRDMSDALENSNFEFFGISDSVNV